MAKKDRKYNGKKGRKYNGKKKALHIKLKM